PSSTCQLKSRPAPWKRRLIASQITVTLAQTTTLACTRTIHHVSNAAGRYTSHKTSDRVTLTLSPAAKNSRGRPSQIARLPSMTLTAMNVAPDPHELAGSCPMPRAPSRATSSARTRTQNCTTGIGKVGSEEWKVESEE